MPEIPVQISEDIFLNGSRISCFITSALLFFQLNMVITSIIILCAIAMAFYKLIQNLEHYYRKKY